MAGGTRGLRWGLKVAGDLDVIGLDNGTCDVDVGCREAFCSEVMSMINMK